VEHLDTILARGLLSDALAQADGLLEVEVGNADIKARRAERIVPAGPGGVVADYVPFYFAPRSPMMSAIHHGRVATYQDGCGRLVYLVTTLERLHDLGVRTVLSDRNAALTVADFWTMEDGEPPEGFVDWPLMLQTMWNRTQEYPDRRERRMAECLVHERVPFEAFEEIVARGQAVADEAESALRRAGSSIPVRVIRDWYF
jgi:hypothetical protein